MKRNAVYGQSGGPTTVINASLAGVIAECAAHPEEIETLYLMRNGIRGLLDEELKDIRDIPSEEIEHLKFTPGAIAGSLRYKMSDASEDESDYLRILNTLKRYHIGYVFLNGGNDSMDTCRKLADYLKAHDYPCAVIGIPKTIDNDLVLTDHTPGYGSAAKFIANIVQSVAYDNESYPKGRVNIIEIMGRDAGWLTASSSLASIRGHGPDLIYVPELPFDIDRFLKDVQQIYEKKGRCLIALSEGVRDRKGNLIFHQKSQDVFSHTQLGGIGQYLCSVIGEKLRLPTRAIELSLLQRCLSSCSSKTDIDEAFETGSVAVRFALQGLTQKMVALRNENGRIVFIPVPLSEVANKIRKMPRDMINEQGNGVTERFIEYARPLIRGESETTYDEGLPVFSDLEKFR